MCSIGFIFSYTIIVRVIYSGVFKGRQARQFPRAPLCNCDVQSTLLSKGPNSNCNVQAGYFTFKGPQRQLQCVNTLLSSSWPIPSLSTMNSALLHFFCVACGWQWITETQRGTPSVAIGSKCFPWLWRDVEACHVTLDVFVAQFGSASSTRRVIELAVEDILGQATIFNTVDVA